MLNQGATLANLLTFPAGGAVGAGRFRGWCFGVCFWELACNCDFDCFCCHNSPHEAKVLHVRSNAPMGVERYAFQFMA